MFAKFGKDLVSRDLIEAVKKVMDRPDENKPDQTEELKGGQVKLDKNRNGKLDSQDFKMLRGEKKGVAEAEGTTKKYEMMHRNGQVKRFVAKDDADAKRIAAGHGAKSVIRMKSNVPGDKIGEKGVAEGSLTEMDKSSPQPGRDGKVSHKTYGSRDNYKLGDPERMAKQVSAEKAKKDALDILKKQGVAEGGPFSYGKPPRKGSVADLAAKHRKEQDRKTPPIEPKDQMVGNAKITKDTKESQLAELDRPSGKLFIIVKADNAGATHVFGDFGSFPQDVMHKVSKRGTRDKSGAKTKLKIDFLFDNFRSTIQQLRTIFRDVDFVGAEAAEFIIHSSALRSDQGEDVKHLRDYIEAGDDRRMKMYQAPEDDEEDDGETTGGNMLRIDPETGAARKVVGVKPQTQMGGKSAEQPGMTTYRFKDPRFAQQLRGMNLGFNIKGDSITVDQKQKAKLVSMLGNKFGDIFTSQERFKEENIELSEKAVSQQQQKFFGMVHAMQKGKKIPGASAELKKTAKSMSKGDATDFAKTRHAGLPKKVSEFKMALPPAGLTPDEAKKFAADQQAQSQSMYQQQQSQQSAQPLPPGAIPGRNSPHPRTHVYDEKLDAWIPGAPLAPTNEDSYMESLSAALEQKLSVNDTLEVWRDDFVNADPVKYKQFRNKTDEKKRHMADVARYRQIQKK